MDWDKLRTFYSVAQCNSMSQAARDLNLSQSAISRQITSLETRLKTPLFQRHARGLVLNEQGEVLFKTVAEMVRKLQYAETTLAETNTKPRGPFKITCPHAIGSIWLAPLMREFTDLYPDIEVSLICEDKELDLTMREADVAIRLFPSTHPDLIEKPLVELHNAVYASNDYVKNYGIPRRFEDLKNHRIIAYDRGRRLPFKDVNWLCESTEAKKHKIKPFFNVNSLVGMRAAVKEGVGIAWLPEYMMYRARHVSRVLDEVQGPATQAYFVYSMELRESTRVRVFKQFVRRKIAEFRF